MGNAEQPAASGFTFARRLGLLYAALFFVVGCYLPFLPVWFDWRALDAGEIAVLLAAPLFTRIVFTPLIGFAADLAGSRRNIVIALAWGSLLSFLLLWAASGFWQMLAASILLAINWTTIMPLIETVAARGIRTGTLHYGRVRLWGSLSFIAANLGSGIIIGLIGAKIVMPLLVTGTMLLVLGAHLLPRDLDGKGRGPAPLSRLKFADAFRLVHAPVFLLFLLAASLIQASHALYYSFGTLHWRAEGIPDGVIGLLWSIGVIAEVALFAASARVIAAVGTARLLMLAGLAAALRWGVMALDPPLLLLGPLQTLHAMSFGAAHVAAIHFLTQVVPEERAATAQGLYAAAVAGIALGSATLASGPLYASFGGAAYGAMALLALTGAAGAYRLTQLWQERPVDAAAIETAQTQEMWPQDFATPPIDPAQDEAAGQPQSSAEGGRTEPPS
ncbi:MAG TPA: MFS transporter [Methyloceanibacter sp.]|jgi:MFS transporter, PPP family, 3-phenylpropionic acid transporter|nr:MFS transporter [Methyloceanibacter sp.]